MEFASMAVPLSKLVLLLLLCVPVNSGRPNEVKVAAIFTFDSVIGRASKKAMEMAVSDINANSTILNGTSLSLIMEDVSCSVFMGSIKAFQVLDSEIVSIIGPQSSAIAHMISHIANAVHVPMVSYAATDPTLSALQFPYFLRTAPSDSYQMAAVADFIDHFGWKEVIAIFLDDDYGRNGISVLGDELAKKMAKISYKLPLPSQYNLSDVTAVLNTSRFLGPRVYVVHINPDPKLRFFRLVRKLNMMTGDYVWLATDWLSATFDSFSSATRVSLRDLEGVIAFRPYIPQTTLKKGFESRWREMQKNDSMLPELNVYGLYAYDTVWTVALSVNELLKEQQNMKFSLINEFKDFKTEQLQFEKLKVFDGGEKLLGHLSQINFTGLTGQIQFGADRNLIIYGFEVLNIVQLTARRIGYWSNYSGFSIVPPEVPTDDQVRRSPQDQKLANITWPGGKADKPRGWVIANNEKPLRIGVPKRASFTEFVTVSNYSRKIEGYCIDLFEEARKLVPYDVPFVYVPFGDGRRNPNYDELVKMVADDVLDAAVGDIAIVTNRTRMADFTQPYVSTGLVILAPVDNSKASTWVFLKPFTPELWAVTAVSFVIIAVVIWVLEHRVNDHFRGPPKRQITTMFLFSFSTLFRANQENTVSTLGRMVMVIWLFLLLVITSSYTASLTSILTVEQLSSPITGIDSLIASNWPIGYQVGSFAFSYMIENLHIKRSRLVRLGSPEEYEKALRLGPGNGGVAAIVDELPYIELFLSERTDFGIVGHSFTRGGWGFAFQKDSPLAVDISTAILKLSENGKLQEINRKWFCKSGCPSERTKHPEPNQLDLSSFWGLYLLCGAVTLTAFLIFLFMTVRQYVRYTRKQMDPTSPVFSISSNTRFSQIIYSFFDFIDEKEEAIKRIFTQHDNSQSQAS